MDAIRSVNLTKVYRGKANVEALKSISLSIKSGQLYTLLGPNGAGKTTFLRIVSTQLLPTSGEAYLLGYDVVKQPEEVRRHIAVVPQDSIAYHNLTPWEYAYYFAKLYGVPSSKVKENAELALKTVDIWHLKDRTCGSLSGGEQKRAIIASALSSDASILMLDEPTSGLDAIARRHVWETLTKIVKDGKTIILTTHIMEEAEMVSDRLAIINKGKLIAEGTREEIKSLSKERFRVVLEGRIENNGLFGDGYRVAKFGNKSIVFFNSLDESLKVVERALAKGLKAEASPITLEDVFVDLVGSELVGGQNH